MYRRLVYLQNRKTLADSGQDTTDVNVTDPITALWVEVRATNGATSNKANLVADCVSKIELIDGSEVFCSLSGKQALALTAYRLGYIPYQLISEEASNVQNLAVPLLFGRWPGDSMFAFNPRVHIRPQIRVTWNLAAVRAVAATAFATGTGQLSLIADVMTGVSDPQGMLTAKEQYTWVTAASGITYIDLPTDWPYRRLLLRAYKAGSAINGVVSNVKLQANQDQVVFFNHRMTDLLRLMTMYQSPFVYKHMFRGVNADTIYPILKQEEAVNLNAETGDATLAYQNYGLGQGALTFTVGGSAVSSPATFSGNVSGWAPFGVVDIPFGDPWSPDEWLQANEYKSLRLEATNAVASGAGEVVVEQARPY
jgi:hypothetical protein